MMVESAVVTTSVMPGRRHRGVASVTVAPCRHERCERRRPVASEGESGPLTPTVGWLNLLLDAENTAVSQATAHAVPAQDAPRGLRLHVLAFGRADEEIRRRADEEIRRKLGECLYDGSGSRWEALVLRLRSLLADAEPEVRQGAAMLTDHMPDHAHHHKR